MCRNRFRLLTAVSIAGLLLALALGSLTTPARSQGNQPAPDRPNAASSSSPPRANASPSPT